MRNRLLLAGTLSVILVLTAAPLGAQTPQGPPPPGMQGQQPHGPWPKPKNLKILPKNISHDDLMKVMHGFAGSLGVKCDFCHEAGADPRHLNFASDAKPEKKIARTMMRMTGTINKKYLSKVDVKEAKPEETHVSCGTCHRGHKIPAVFVPPPEHHHGMPGMPGPGGAAKSGPGGGAKPE